MGQGSWGPVMQQDEVERRIDVSSDAGYDVAERFPHGPRGLASRDLTKSRIAAVPPDQQISLHAKIDLIVFRSADASTRFEHGDPTLVLSD
jgi:hypothetical protein